MTKLTKSKVQNCTSESLKTINKADFKVQAIPSKDPKLMHYKSREILEILKKAHGRIPFKKDNPNYHINKRLIPGNEILITDNEKTLKITDITIVCTSLCQFPIEDLIPRDWDKASLIVNKDLFIIAKVEKLKEADKKEYMVEIPGYQDGEYKYYIIAAIRVSFTHKVPSYGLVEFTTEEIEYPERHEAQLNLYLENIDLIMEMLEEMYTFEIINGHTKNFKKDAHSKSKKPCTLSGILFASEELDRKISLKTTDSETTKTESFR